VNQLRDQEASGSESSQPIAHSFSALIVTHYARILDYITPDKVHVMVNGKIVQSGGPEFAKELEKEGYVKYGIKE
jgi:Fe-S cluster assembly ATPase SufC